MGYSAETPYDPGYEAGRRFVSQIDGKSPKEILGIVTDPSDLTKQNYHDYSSQRAELALDYLKFALENGKYNPGDVADTQKALTKIAAQYAVAQTNDHSEGSGKPKLSCYKACNGF